MKKEIQKKFLELQDQIHSIAISIEKDLEAEKNTYPYLYMLALNVEVALKEVEEDLQKLMNELQRLGRSR
jgi:hypothetical protein